MEYLEYTFSGFTDDSIREILIALLDQAGYSGFQETTKGLKAWIEQARQNETELERILAELSGTEGRVAYVCEKIPPENWNKKWEKDFDPIEIDQAVRIRASFHAHMSEFKHEILIDPKMSFGTGHHETTRLMIRAMMKLDLVNKKVLDVGCGTGVLSIYASKKGCSDAVAVDIDEWACSNAEENRINNHCENIRILQATATELKGQGFDIILANINRNVLVQDMTVYADKLCRDGYLLLSGLLEEDHRHVLKEANARGFVEKEVLRENNWLAIIFIKEA